MVARVLRVLLQPSELKRVVGRGRHQLPKGKKHIRSHHIAAVVRLHRQRSQMVQQPVLRRRRLAARHLRNHRTVGIDHVRPRASAGIQFRQHSALEVDILRRRAAHGLLHPLVQRIIHVLRPAARRQHPIRIVLVRIYAVRRQYNPMSVAAATETWGTPMDLSQTWATRL